MAWTRKPYCSTDDVKALLNKRTNVDDDFIAGLIVDAQAWVDERLGFSFQTDGDATTPATRLYNGNNHEQLLIDRCMSLATVSVLTYHVSSNPLGGLLRTSTANDITGDVLLGPQGRSPGFLLECLTLYFPLGKANIQVSGVFGYATIPDDISRATARLAAHYLLARDAGYEDKTSGGSQAGYGTKTFKASSVPEDIECAVDRHRHHIFR